jgi:FtsP/CotA-like multicopper oxidase with cupredoxin domain
MVTDLTLTRRQFLAVAAGLVASPCVVAAVREWRTLRTSVARVAIAGAPHPQTEVWSYDASVPGPVLRYKRGDRLRIRVDNQLAQATTIHWHGVRVPNAMDGVPHVTQPPIAAGASFDYEFALPDAGTFWYHPHLGNPEQVARGLYGALVVEEEKPPAVDRDVVWVLGDWRLDRDARIVENFRNFMDASHAGRIGNTVTINGTVPQSFEVRPGERIRLRLVNAASARIYALDFRGHDPVVIAHDAHAVEPYRLDGGRVVLGPGMRTDVILDATGDPRSVHTVVDDFYAARAYRLIDLRYAAGRGRGRPRRAPARLEANPVSEPDLANAIRHEIRFEGGMGGALPPGSESMTAGNARSLWTVNGKALNDDQHHGHAPLFDLALGRSYVLDLVNDTAWHHPIHLHGHVFRVLTIDGKPTQRREWRDTVLLDPDSRAQIAFKADNAGDWMLHCHVLEHQASGMMSLIRIG